MQNCVELKVGGVSKGLALAHAYVLLLKEIDGERSMPVIIGASEAQSISFALKGFKPPRPFTHDLFVDFCEQCHTRLKHVYIYKVEEGVFYAYLYFEKGDAEVCVDARTSDAVALALRLHAPIYTSEEILSSEHVDLEKGATISIPITAIPVGKLQEALEQAVKNENYELASKFRDELARRKQDQILPDDNLMNL